MQQRYSPAGMDTGQAEKIGVILQERLASLIDLALILKHVHWNVVGSGFLAVHEMMDTQTEDVRGMVDTVAERISTLGGIAGGLASQVVEMRSASDEYSLGRAPVMSHLGALDKVYERVGNGHREAIEQVASLDPITEDLLISQTAQLEMNHWFIRATCWIPTVGWPPRTPPHRWMRPLPRLMRYSLRRYPRKSRKKWAPEVTVRPAGQSARCPTRPGRPLHRLSHARIAGLEGREAALRDVFARHRHRRPLILRLGYSSHRGDFECRRSLRRWLRCPLNPPTGRVEDCLPAAAWRETIRRTPARPKFARKDEAIAHALAWTIRWPQRGNSQHVTVDQPANADFVAAVSLISGTR